MNSQHIILMRKGSITLDGTHFLTPSGFPIFTSKKNPRTRENSSTHTHRVNSVEESKNNPKMAILSDYEEDRNDKKSSPSPSCTSPKTPMFTAAFNPQNPIRIVETVLDFLGKESNFLEKDTAEKEIFAVVKRAVEEKKRKKAEEEAKVKEENKRLKKEEVKENEEKVQEGENKEQSAKRGKIKMGFV